LRDIGARGLAIAAHGADLRLTGPTERMDGELVARIRAAKPDLVAHLSAPAGLPLTPLQSAYLFGRGDLAELGDVASPVYHGIEGCWDLTRLQRALRAVVARHPALRTEITAEGRQLVHAEVPVHLRVRDLRALPARAREQVRAAQRERCSHTILPLS